MKKIQITVSIPPNGVTEFLTPTRSTETKCLNIPLQIQSKLFDATLILKRMQIYLNCLHPEKKIYDAFNHQFRLQTTST